MPEEKQRAAVGLKNIHYALVLTDDPTGATYGTPKKLAPALSANVSPTVNSATLNADDGPILVADALGEIKVDLGVSDVPLSIQAELLGSTLKENGLLVDNANDQAPEVALGFERTMNDGSSRFTWLLKGKFQKFAEEAKTKEGTPSFQTPTITGTFLKRIFDDNWRFRADSGVAGSEALIASWFTAVPSEIPNP
ncbi:phage tail protein [Paenibacillus dokdonensis]|uniref:Phage tail protein n=1 Tax=Paenibacillus dokdonensis TaxID=2567944 RepID=A0ABU6GSU0_9BACL|nr:major tail protein [Paenibacillus dokdonensis]MEC0242766.1 phage tail protein [Paenibacillus dokdonensis]